MSAIGVESEAMSLSSPSIATGTAGTFAAYLEAHPETQEALRQRIEAYPEYATWLDGFGRTVLSALRRGVDGARVGGTSTAA